METIIREKALELGYDECGIIRVDALAGYLDRVEERIASIPMGEALYGKYRAWADPRAEFPDVKSIIVCIVPTYRYTIPDGLDGVYGKAFLFDNRVDDGAPFFRKRIEFTSFLESRGMTVFKGDSFGFPAPARWAAQQAGLGIIRRNNFFYTHSGSYVFIEMFAVDRELELVHDVKLKPCPPGCRRCIESCPSRSLSGPYTMSMATCVSFHTNLSAKVGSGIPSDEMTRMIGTRLFGCDRCQDACPHNTGRWKGGEDFPGLDALTEMMSPERIMQAGPEELWERFGRKFWYIGRDRLWKWKINALTAMMNAYEEKYEAAIKQGLADPEEKVRDFARMVCSQLGIG